MQTARVECKSMSLLLRLVDHVSLESGHFSICVGPEADCSIRRASRNQLLFNTNIEAKNLLRMEGRDHMLIFVLFVRPLRVEVKNLEELARGSGEDNSVLHGRCQLN